jgi:DNA-binding NtrC family response regulator
MHMNSQPHRVLVVDDEPLIRWSVSETLSDHGFHVVESGDAQSARNAVRDASREFDVVLMDLRLPDSDDLSLLRALRTMAPHAQLILMTAFGTPEIEHDAMDSGAFRVLSKPFEIEEVARAVAEATVAGPACPGVFPVTAN